MAKRKYSTLTAHHLDNLVEEHFSLYARIHAEVPLVVPEPVAGKCYVVSEYQRTLTSACSFLLTENAMSNSLYNLFYHAHQLAIRYDSRMAEQVCRMVDLN